MPEIPKRIYPFLDSIWCKIILLFMSVFASILLVEICLRLLSNDLFANSAREIPVFRNGNDLHDRYTVDPEFGFRPILDGKEYDQFGTKRNGYDIEKSPDCLRVLFIGDSATARGKIINAIRKVYGDNSYEFWNAGVDSFNTIQEVKYYYRYNCKINPDHVILSFHLNDFETTPVAYLNQKGNLLVYRPNMPQKKMSFFLYRNSYLYRFIQGLRYKEGPDLVKIISEIYDTLESFDQHLKGRGIKFTILVLPLFKPFENWTPIEKKPREIILSILEKLNIHHIDLLPPLQKASRDHVILEEVPGDYWHPSEEISTYFAEYLKEIDFIP